MYVGPKTVQEKKQALVASCVFFDYLSHGVLNLAVALEAHALVYPLIHEHLGVSQA